MLLKVKYFARFGELAGRAEELLETRDDIRVYDLKRKVLEDHPLLASFESSVIVAWNENFARDDENLRAGDEIDFFRPSAADNPS
ncbi:MAG: MoaD/ThiS family protein [Thermoplasmatales archaeon]